VLPKKLRIAMLFIGSLIFYGFWRWEFLFLMLTSTFLDYWASLKIHKHKDSPKLKRLFVLISMGVNIGFLIFFKYLYFISENVLWVAQFFNYDFPIGQLKMILPLGISFYTFQTMSYTLDVYRGHAIPQRNFMLYGAYVTYFPQLVAGPILRAGEVIFQLEKRPKFEISFILEGVKRILIGLFLKVALADNIAPLVDESFLISPDGLSAIDVWTMAFLFGFQIYFDFAGYSHIAIGSAKCMGIHFPENFNFPYMANSIKSFWRRWHISLSSWIRDYLYLPLAGKKVKFGLEKSVGGLSQEVGAIEKGKDRTTRALFLTWAIMGLWHGANWTFVLWGLIHASAVYVERIIKSLQRFDKLRISIIGWCLTLGIAMLSWIPFRAADLSTTFKLIGHIFNPLKYTYYSFKENLYLVAFFLFIAHVFAFFINEKQNQFRQRFSWLYHPLEVIMFTVIIVIVVIFLRPISQFIYFQF
jgi:D-alanyl-lipoteichoic acid acyltransferase DltB (MBOAT superfamily)